MRSLLLILAFVMVVPQAWALRGGPFDSSSNQSGVDLRRGTFEVTIRGKNLIGFCRISASSSFESYGSSRMYYEGVNCQGSATGTIGDDECVVIFNCSGITATRGADISGFVDMKTDSTGSDFRASGTGEAVGTSRGALVREQLESLDIDFGAIAQQLAGTDISIGGDAEFNVDEFAQPLRTLLTFLLSQGESVGDTEEIVIRGDLVRTSLLPSTQAITIQDDNGNQYPLFINPTDVDTILDIYDTVTESED